MENSTPEQASKLAAPEQTSVRIPHEQLTYESIKAAVYDHAKRLYDQKRTITTLHLGKDLYEILNKRLVFRTAAHRELPHFITPSGSLRVPPPEEGAVQTDCFVID